MACAWRPTAGVVGQALRGKPRYTAVADPETPTGDFSAVVRDSQAAVLASAERITVVGRWVVLAAGVLLHHFGDQNSPAPVFLGDTILFSWGPGQPGGSGGPGRGR